MVDQVFVFLKACEKPSMFFTTVRVCGSEIWSSKGSSVPVNWIICPQADSEFLKSVCIARIALFESRVRNEVLGIQDGKAEKRQRDK